MSKTTIVQGPDGRLYEIPDQMLAEFAVPGDRVAELRKRLAEPAGGASAAGPGSPPSSSHAGAGAGAALPPRHAALPPDHAAAPPGSMSMSAGSGVVLNFYFQTPPSAAGAGRASPSDLGVDGYHMTFDENGIPVNHSEMLWGDYIDKQGNPAVGWHSHDPVTGNAQ
jgi:hypothetical protein